MVTAVQEAISSKYFTFNQCTIPDKWYTIFYLYIYILVVKYLILSARYLLDPDLKLQDLNQRRALR